MIRLNSISVGTLVVVILMISSTLGDIYMHNPRGSNDRLKAASGNRKNANRLFDSQNNAAGGYNVGEKTASKAASADDLYEMMYFQSGSDGSKSKLILEWTDQHGCNTDELNCQVVIQMMCQPENTNDQWPIKDGFTESTSIFTKPNSTGETLEDMEARRSSDAASNNDRGVHESWDWYNHCYHRQRNKHLFAADERFKKSVKVFGESIESSIYTRQDTNGNRYGFECPEERDYYPYFHPDPWKDIAVLTDDVAECNHRYVEASFSGQTSRGLCASSDGTTREPKHFIYNNQTACEMNNFTWVQVFNYLEKAKQFTSQIQCESASSVSGISHFWAIPYDSGANLVAECLVELPKPDCRESIGTRANHHGSAEGSQENPRYEWDLPYFPSGESQRCVMRMRYNITSYDFDPWNTDWTSNQPNYWDVRRHYMSLYKEQSKVIWSNRSISSTERRAMAAELKQQLLAEAEVEYENNLSPTQDDPDIIILPGFPQLQFATEPDQMGRVFQDRTHSFLLVPRPAGTQGKTIHNLNVKGKRGNIVQAYPAIEYDFIPNSMELKSADCLVHIQWTGSNSQPGAGEGKSNTDRSNIVQVDNNGVNYPLSNTSMSLWDGVTVYWTPFNGKDGMTVENLALAFGTAGHYWCLHNSTCPDWVPGDHVAPAKITKSDLNPTLDQAPASFSGMLLGFGQGRHFYVSSRNNAFSNRMQRGVINVI